MYRSGSGFDLDRVLDLVLDLAQDLVRDRDLILYRSHAGGASLVHPGPALTWEFPCQSGGSLAHAGAALTWESPCQSERVGRAGFTQDMR